MKIPKPFPSFVGEVEFGGFDFILHKRRKQERTVNAVLRDPRGEVRRGQSHRVVRKVGCGHRRIARLHYGFQDCWLVAAGHAVAGVGEACDEFSCEGFQ